MLRRVQRNHHALELAGQQERVDHQSSEVQREVELSVGDMMKAEELYREPKRKLEQPSQERTGAVGFVCCQCIRAKRVPIGGARQHLLGGDDLLAHPGRGRLDVHDDTVIGVDQIVGLIAEPSRSILDGPRRLRVSF